MVRVAPLAKVATDPLEVRVTVAESAPKIAFVQSPALLNVFVQEPLIVMVFPPGPAIVHEFQDSVPTPDPLHE